MIKEFKKFIARGNVLDLAVGVIIGSAFSAIVTSLVNNVFTPLIGIIFGGIDFSGLAVKIGEEQILYGAFIQSIFDFLVTAVCLFVIVKVVNGFNDNMHKNMEKLNKKNKNVKEEEKVVEVKKSDDILLLEEIRDLLKEKNKKGDK